MTSPIRGVGATTGGAILVIAGVAFALERAAGAHGLWRWLPLIALYLAVRDARGTARGSRTLVPTLSAVWLQLTAIGFWGLDFVNAWPLLIALVGIGLLIDGLAEGARSPQAPTKD